MFQDPETHAANGPSTWEVKKVGRTWGVYTKDGGQLDLNLRTKREALDARENGVYAKMYERQTKWFTGAPHHRGGKTWEEVKAERVKHDAWVAARAAAKTDES